MMSETLPSTSTAGPTAAWTDRYLALLDVPAGPPSLEQLSALVRAHVLTVPFENITAILRRRDHPEGPVPQPDPEQLLSNWESRSGGGVCFEIAMMFERLLSALGYKTHLVLGQISLPFGHQAIIVELDGRRYLVDMGSGAPIWNPQLLDNGTTEVHVHGLSYRFRPSDDPGEMFQDRMIDGEWKQHCKYTMSPAADEDKNKGYQHHHTPNASWVTGSLTMVFSTENEVYSLKDTALTRHTAAGKSVETLTDEASYRKTVAEKYRLPQLSIADALAVRAQFAQLGSGGTLVR